MTVLVTGAAGFVGRHAVRALVERGVSVRALVRSVSGATLLDDAECELARGDVTDPASLAEAIAGADAVVHLVAIIHGRPAEFERVIEGGTRNVVEAARAAGVRRFVQMSALGTSAATKDSVPYYRAKWNAQQVVRESGLSHAILRPSFVFGGDGGVLPRLARIARLAPVTPIVGRGSQRIQPIWVDDVSRALALTVTRDDSLEVELGGPDVVDWNELWSRLKATLGTRRPSLHVPPWLIRPQALLLERLPDPPVTRDQLRMLELGDNVVTDGGVGMAALGLGDLVPLTEQLRRATQSPG
jgi:uncharacterized protein YbjT (DUF2867 family)